MRICDVEGCGRPHCARGLCRPCYSVQYERNNRETRGPARRARYAKNRQHENERNMAWARANRDKVAAIDRRWRKNNKDKVNAKVDRRLTRKTAAGGSYTSAEWCALLEEFGHVCPGCGRAKKLEADHIIPVSWGGPSWIWNIQPLCRSCNSRKNDLMIIAYRPWAPGAPRRP